MKYLSIAAILLCMTACATNQPVTPETDPHDGIVIENNPTSP